MYRPVPLHEHDEMPYTRCLGCGCWIVYTPTGWQHDAAPYFCGNDGHDPAADQIAMDIAHRYEATHCLHLPGADGVCTFCGWQVTS